MDITLPGLYLFKNAQIYAPDFLGTQDMLVAGDKLSPLRQISTPEVYPAAK